MDEIKDINLSEYPFILKSIVWTFVIIINRGGALCICSSFAKYPNIPLSIILNDKEHSSSQRGKLRRNALNLKKMPKINIKANKNQ